MTTQTNHMEAIIDHEGQVAERYRWWGVYLIREKRRLQGIAEVVQARAAQDAVRATPRTPASPERALPSEAPEELLTRVDAELALSAALDELDQTPPNDSDDLPRKLAGRATLLGQQARQRADEKGQKT